MREISCGSSSFGMNDLYLIGSGRGIIELRVNWFGQLMTVERETK